MAHFTEASHRFQVTITSSPANADPTPERQTPRLGVNSLPDAIQRSFASTFIPCVLAKLGCSSMLWLCVEVEVLQNLFDLTYPKHELTIVKRDALESAVRSPIPDSPLACTHTSQDELKGYDL